MAECICLVSFLAALPRLCRVVLIGGAARDLLMAEAGLDFQTAKDIRTRQVACVFSVVTPAEALCC